MASKCRRKIVPPKPRNPHAYNMAVRTGSAAGAHKAKKSVKGTRTQQKRRAIESSRR